MQPPKVFSLSPRVTALFKLVAQIADSLSPAERRIVPTLAYLFRDLTVELRARKVRKESST